MSEYLPDMEEVPPKNMHIRVESASGKVRLAVTDRELQVTLAPLLSSAEAHDLARLLTTAAVVVDPSSRPAQPGTTVGLIRDGDALALTVSEGAVRIALPLSVLEASVLVEQLQARLVAIVRDELPD